MKSIIFSLEFLWLWEIIYCFLCGKTNFRFYCLENLHNNGKTFSLRFHCKLKTTQNPFPSWFEVSILLCLFHSCWLGITCIRVFFIFPFIFPSPFEIAQQSPSTRGRHFHDVFRSCMTFNLQWSWLRVDWEPNLAHFLTVFKMAIVNAEIMSVNNVMERTIL